MRSTLIRLSILASLCLYTIFKAIQIWPSHTLLAPQLAAILLIVMVGWLFLYRSKPHLLDTPWFKIIIWIGSLSMGFWSTFVLLSLPIDFIFLLNYIFHLFIPASDPHKITLIHYKINIILLLITTGITILGFIEVLRGPKVRKFNLPIKNLPDALKNFKIAQISDLHVGPTIQKSYVEKVVRLTNATDPDIIVITGDIADAKPDLIADHLQPLSSLRARLGIYYITGNHEYYWGGQEWVDKVKELGFIPLINENRILNINNTKILIAGITDQVGGHFLSGHQPDMTKAAHSDEITSFKILLAHRPDVYLEAEKLNFNLQFSGHTHSGQFFPFNVLIPLAYKYHTRLNQYGNLWMYVNPGTGYWGPANRFGIPAEITLCTLQKK